VDLAYSVAAEASDWRERSRLLSTTGMGTARMIAHQITTWSTGVIAGGDAPAGRRTA
jgi:hypothetical protein